MFFKTLHFSFLCASVDSNPHVEWFQLESCHITANTCWPELAPCQARKYSINYPDQRHPAFHIMSCPRWAILYPQDQYSSCAPCFPVPLLHLPCKFPPNSLTNLGFLLMAKVTSCRGIPQRVRAILHPPLYACFADIHIYHVPLTLLLLSWWWSFFSVATHSLTSCLNSLLRSRSLI